MTGFVHVIVPESRFRLMKAADTLTSYTVQHRRRPTICSAPSAA